jgi:hypothetical protein
MTVFKSGQWNSNCDRCGQKFKSGRLRLEWTNLRCCHGVGTNNCWQARNEQEFVRGVPDRQNPPWVRPNDDGPDVGPNSVLPGDL